MKKFRDYDGRILLRFLPKKTIRVMKLTLFLSLFAVIQLWATETYSQLTQLTLKLDDVTISDALKEIENQSEFFFLYSPKLIDVEKKVNIDAENETIKDILAGIFDEKVKFAAFDRQVVLTPIEKFEIISELQQQKQVTGIVSDKNGPIPGANVIITGTTTGTITDSNGRYSLDIPQGAEGLTFTFIGMEPKEVIIGTLTKIDVLMSETAIGLDEVIVVGYGTQRARDVTGSISTVGTAELADLSVTTASETLKGNVSGITVTDSHVPGDKATIRIRGIGTINNNDPLWVVDGVPGAEDVNPNNIATISVLKDASAQAIYGARAANGVILVTTKTGRRNQALQVNVNVKNGFSNSATSYDLLNTQEYGEYLWLMAKNMGIADYSHALYGSGLTPDIPEYIIPARGTNVDLSLYDNKMVHEDGDDTFLITKANKEGTDWQKEIQHTAVYREYAIDASGGTAKSSYSFMVNYLNQEGTLLNTDYKRYNLRSNATFYPKDWLEIGERIGVKYDEDSGFQYEGSGSAYHQAIAIQPIIPVYDVMGNFISSQVPTTGNSSNPVFYLNSNRHDVRKGLSSIGNVYAKINFLEGLNFKTLFGFNYYGNKSRNINYNEVGTAERNPYDALSESALFGSQWNWSNTIEYSKTFASKHSLSLLAGTEAVNSYYESINGSRTNFFFEDPDYMILSSGVQDQLNSGTASDWKLFSIFTRINYSFADKYLLTSTLRRDGSSRFGTLNRYGTFPAFSVGWIISEENFMAFSKNWLDNMKIRFGWGKSGNDQIGNYNGYTTFDSRSTGSFSGSPSSYYDLTGANVSAQPGFQSSAFGNPDVRWETSTTRNFGLNASILKNITIDVDVWQRLTDDMLYPKQIPYVVGVASYPSVNVGSMLNRGFDFELNYSGAALNKELQYNVGVTISHYNTEIQKLSGAEGEFIQGGENRNYYFTRASSGTAFPEYFGYVVEGIFQTAEEAAAHPKAFGAGGTYNEEGRFKYKDLNDDGVINDEDRTYLGSPHPDFTAGLNLNIHYKNISLSARFYSVYGNKLINQEDTYLFYNLFTGNRSTKVLYNSWGSPYLANNADAELPKVEWNDSGNQQASSAYIQDGSYLRFQNLKIGYDLGKIVNKYIDSRELKIYGQVTNLFTLTKYEGLDPEVNSSGMRQGLDLGAWPTPRQFIFGISMGF
jgi:TonB-dependent starch-binding outer membrane protein SusC